MISKDIDWKAIALFQDLRDEEVRQVMHIFDTIRIPAGENLVTEGEEGEEMYVMTKGQVRITKSMIIGDVELPLLDSGSARKVLATLDGEHYPLFGEIALIDRDTRSATITVIEDAEFLYTNRTRFFHLVQSNTSLGTQLLLVLAKRMASTVRRSNQELVKLTTALALALDRAART